MKFLVLISIFTFITIFTISPRSSHASSSSSSNSSIEDGNQTGRRGRALVARKSLSTYCKLNHDVKVIIAKHEENLLSYLSRHSRILRKEVSNPLMGELSQQEILRESQQYLGNVFKQYLTDLHADLKDAVRKKWESQEGPVRRRRNAFDSSLPKGGESSGRSGKDGPSPFLRGLDIRDLAHDR